jgi:HEAT repeat protein/phage terminase Nu1 subunit (DNA packaging protein)
MPAPDDLLAILNHIVNRQHTDADLEVLRQALTGNSAQNVVQLGKYTVNIGQGQDIRIGDQITYQGTDAETIRGVFCSVLQEMQISGQQPATSPPMSPEAQKDAVCQFLENIEENFKYIRLFHTQQPITLKDQYIPIQVTLEPHKRDVETLRGYWESEEELKRVYALKGGEEKAEEELKRQQVDWQEAKCQYQRIMVLADPGMGKSTLLRMEAGAIAQQERQQLEGDKALEDVIFPLFLRLSELAKKSEEIIDAIPELIQRDYPNTAPPLIPLLKEKLKTGKCLLLLDALDEVPKVDRNRIELKEKLNRFVGNYSCPIICTSRIVGYDGAFVDGAKEVEIVPFSDKHIEQYIEIWFTNAAEQLSGKSVSAAELVRELRSKPQVRGLAQNPLLLSLICSLYQEKGLTLPARRCQVYEKAVEYMLGKWSQNRRDQSEGRIRAKLLLLENLAYSFSCEGQEVFEFDDLYDQIEDYLQGERVPIDLRNAVTSELITELSEQDGILQKLYAESDEYLFLHRTFQEYLTAGYLERAKNGIDLVKEHLWDYDWHEIISLMAGLMKKPIRLLQAITSENDDIFQTLLLLAGRCIAECNETSHSLIAEIIDRIFMFWEAYPDAEFIRSVVVALGQANSQMFKRLQIALRHENSHVRQMVARALGSIGTSQSVEALISAFNGDNWFREEVVGALGQIGSSQAVEAIVSILSDKEVDKGVRVSAATALGQIGSSQAVEALISALNDESGFIRDMVIDSLGDTGSSQALEPLILALSHESALTRQLAVRALGSIGTSQAVEVLISALSDEDVFVKKSAARVLEQIGSCQAVEALISAFNNEDNWVIEEEEDNWVIEEEGGALDWIDSELIERLKMSTPFMYSHSRAAVVKALGHLGNSQAVETLSKALKDSDFNVRLQAGLALSEMGSPLGIEALSQALKDDDRDFRLQTVLALSEMGSSLGIEALSQALKDNDRDVRLQAALALSEMGSSLGIEALSQALKDDDRDVRLQAALALGQITNSKTVETLVKSHERELLILLIRAFGHEDNKIRHQVICALEKIDNPYAIEVLIIALQDIDFRDNAASILRKMANSATLEKLIHSSEIDIYEPYIFSLARTLAVRFSQEGLPFIPVYRPY